jgi:hypothetical protein
MNHRQLQIISTTLLMLVGSARIQQRRRIAAARDLERSQGPTARAAGFVDSAPAQYGSAPQRVVKPDAYVGASGFWWHVLAWGKLERGEVSVANDAGELL